MARTAPGKGTQIELDDRRAPHPMRWYRCSRCVIEYQSDRGTPKCPLCAMELTRDQLREALQAATNNIERLEHDLTASAQQLNIQAAIRAATDLLNDTDRAFLKTVLYQFRMDRSVALRVTHDTEGTPIGFLAEWRSRDPEAITCSSIGGRALAGYFEEAQNSLGAAQAMQVMLRSCQHLLPGGS